MGPTIEPAEIMLSDYQDIQGLSRSVLTEQHSQLIDAETQDDSIAIPASVMSLARRIIPHLTNQDRVADLSLIKDLAILEASGFSITTDSNACNQLVNFVTMHGYAREMIECFTSISRALTDASREERSRCFAEVESALLLLILGGSTPYGYLDAVRSLEPCCSLEVLQGLTSIARSCDNWSDQIFTGIASMSNKLGGVVSAELLQDLAQNIEELGADKSYPIVRFVLPFATSDAQLLSPRIPFIAKVVGPLSFTAVFLGVNQPLMNLANGFPMGPVDWFWCGVAANAAALWGCCRFITNYLKQPFDRKSLSSIWERAVAIGNVAGFDQFDATEYLWSRPGNTGWILANTDYIVTRLSSNQGAGIDPVAAFTRFYARSFVELVEFHKEIKKEVADFINSVTVTEL